MTSKGSSREISAEIHRTHGLRGGSDGLERILRITSACNQRCPFCFVLATGKAVDTADIERALDALVESGARSQEITISGGEPTADPRLPRIIELARQKGFRRFALQTNGVFLARPGLMEALVKLGVRTYMVSFHSHKPGFYDRITGSRRQYRLAVAGLSRLIHSGRCRVCVNIVVNEWNYRDLPGLAGFIGGLSADIPRRRRPSVFFSMINDSGHDKAPSWAVDLSRVAPFLRRAVERCRRESIRVHRFMGESSFPVCLLSRPARYAPLGSFPQERIRYFEGIRPDPGAVGRVKRSSCRRCPYDSRCPGVSARYADLFGLGALSPERGSLPHICTMRDEVDP